VLFKHREIYASVKLRGGGGFIPRLRLAQRAEKFRRNKVSQSRMSAAKLYWQAGVLLAVRESSD
jgi:hypothetical protein